MRVGQLKWHKNAYLLSKHRLKMAAEMFSKIFLFTVTVVVVFHTCSMQRRILVQYDTHSNMSVSFITLADPKEQGLRAQNETEKWIEVLKESRKRTQRRARGEL